jgi:hypothetical protein
MNQTKDFKDARPGPAQKARQSSRLWWLLSFVVAVLLLSRVLLHLQTRNDYSLCSHTNSIYTVNETQPTAQCISVRGGRISAVGAEGAVSRLWCYGSDYWTADIRRHWFADMLYPSVAKILYIEPEQIIVPGIAGTFRIFWRP